ncbi:MAG: hypothetical protein KBD25_06270 [Rickettsiaceae bacterium]|nr:hypothetical protein [Rickettsiaceae bacterium]
MRNLSGIIKNKPLILAIIVAVLVMGVFGGIRLVEKKNRHDGIVQAGLQTYLAKNDQQKLIALQAGAKTINSRSINPLKSDASNKDRSSQGNSIVEDPDLELVCEAFIEIGEYWYQVFIGELENPLPELQEYLNEALEEEDWDEIEEILDALFPDIYASFDTNFDGELDSWELEAAVALVAGATPESIYNSMLEGYIEMIELCGEYWGDDWEISGFGYGSGSGMGTGSY